MRIALLFLFLLTSIAAHAEVWVSAAKTDGGITISYDSSSVNRLGDIVTFWELSNYPPNAGQGGPIRSKKTQIEANCKTGLDRATKILAYSKPNAGGDIVDISLNDGAKWSPSLNGTAGEVMLQIICSLKI